MLRVGTEPNLWGEPCKVEMETKREKSEKKEIHRNKQGQSKDGNLKSLVPWDPKTRRKDQLGQM